MQPLFNLKARMPTVSTRVYAQHLLQQAIHQGASDLHIEPTAEDYQIRIRIDALLHPVTHLTKNQGSQLNAHIKALSQLNITEQRLPQDGGFLWHESEPITHIRVSTLTNIYGEKLVLRLHCQNWAHLSLNQLGFTLKQLKLFQQTLSKPQGLILVTGPTGSGKTKTLYAALSHLNHDQRHIATVEDPVEIHVPGFHQIQINPRINLGFSQALRALLRQDPDILMLGEMRDACSAEIVIQAAQTGHLVLSSMHTNSAFESLSRLVTLGLQPQILIQSLQLIVSQRLVRLLCAKCKQPDPSTQSKISALQHSCEHFSQTTFYKAVGCDACFQGYRGRMGIFEFLNLKKEDKNQALRQLHSSNASCMLQHQKELRSSGLQAAAAGKTSLDELLRVLDHNSSAL